MSSAARCAGSASRRTGRGVWIVMAGDQRAGVPVSVWTSSGTFIHRFDVTVTASGRYTHRARVALLHEGEGREVPG